MKPLSQTLTLPPRSTARLPDPALARERFRLPGRLSIAPMIDKTDRHFRHFVRMFSSRVVLYTEMVAAAAIVHGPRKRLLDFQENQHPIVLQIGGDDPQLCAEAVRIASDWGYDEFNLNVGCPSDKVQKASFGACLMADPMRVADIVAAMRSATDKPVTVKHRIGIEGRGVSRTDYDHMLTFVDTVREAGSERFIVHARIAMLEGLDPKQNRTIPPLRYEDVHRLKMERPHLHIEINGGFKQATDIYAQMGMGMDGVMLGRVSYENPSILAQLDALDEAMEMACRDRHNPPQADQVTLPMRELPTSTPVFGEPLIPVLPELPDFSTEQKIEIVLQYASYIDQTCAALIEAAALHQTVSEQGAVVRQPGTRREKPHLINPRALVWPVLDLFPGLHGSRRYRQVLSESFPRGTKVYDVAKRAVAELGFAGSTRAKHAPT